MEAPPTVASPAVTPPATRPPRRRRRVWPVLLLAIPVLVGGAALWFNEPLDEPAPSSKKKDSAPTIAAKEDPTPAVAPLTWPEGKVEGLAAKQFLLDYLLAAQERLGKVEYYTAIFRKHERIGGTLGPVHIMEMKVRHQPFSIYFKGIEPKAGREALYVEGKHEGKLIVHNNDISSLLLPRLAIDPKSSLALADNRHPITEAGLANLVAKLLRFRRMDLDDQDAVTILDRTTDDKGRSWNRSLHLHSHYNPERPFQHIEVLYDPETRLPHQITSYEWAKDGRTTDLDLGEKYTFEDLKLDALLDDDDFSTANPDYHFQRKLR